MEMYLKVGLPVYAINHVCHIKELEFTLISDYKNWTNENP